MTDISLEQLPGTLPIVMVDGNDFVFALNWNSDMTGYSFVANIYPIGVTTTAIPITVTVVNVALGTYTITITKTSIASLPKNVAHKWRLDWTTPSPALTRTVLAGSFTVLDK